jgi:hypothetical protein
MPRNFLLLFHTWAATENYEDGYIYFLGHLVLVLRIPNI